MGELIVEAGIVVAGVFLARLLRNTITPKSSNIATSTAPVPMIIPVIGELDDAGCVVG